MSDFLHNLGQAVNETAHKAFQASSEAVELAKLSVNIKLDESKKSNIFKEIGKFIYAEYKSDPESANPDIVEFCKCIDELDAVICDQKVRAAKLRKQKFCPGCGAKLDLNMSFCPGCGIRQPEMTESAGSAE